MGGSESKPPIKTQFCTEFTERSSISFQTEQFVDCTFLVGPKSNQELIYAHKLILALTSPVFEAMFYGCLAEGDPVKIPDIVPTDFKLLLSYIYRNEVAISSIEQASGLYYSAKKFMLSHLQQKCSDFLIRNLDYSNACRIYEFGQLFEDENIKDKSTKIMSKNTNQVLSDPSFLQIQLSTLIHIFSLDKLCIDTEMDLFEAAVRYKEAEKPTQNASNDKDLSIQNAVEKIRFYTIPSEKFADCKVKTSLLTDLEVLGVLSNIVSRKTEVPYPERLCKSQVSRVLTV